MFNMKNKFNFKKLIITSICLLFGLTLSGLFVWQTASVGDKKQVGCVAAGQANVNTSFADLPLSVDWGNSSNNNIQLASTNATNPASGKYSYDISNMPETIVAGTIISVSSSSLKYYIYFDSNGDGDYDEEADGYVIITPAAGYTVSKISFQDKDGNEKYFYQSYIFYTAEGKSSGLSTLTPELIDPNYTGTLKFETQVNALSYSVCFFYRDSDGSYNSDHMVKKYYSRDDALTESEINATQYPDPNTEELVTPSCWEFNATKAGYTKNSNNQIKIRNTTFSFDADYEKIRDGNTYYKLIGISGYGLFIDDYGQDPSDPIIVACESNKYDVIINSGAQDSYWSQISAADFTAADKAKLYGARKDTTTNTTIVQNSTTISINLNTPQIFYLGDGDSFKKLADFTSFTNYGYFVYNYGHYITGYQISYSTPVSSGYVSYSTASGWAASASESGGFTDAGQLEEVSFGSLSLFLDDNITTNAVPTITITPVWDETSINIMTDSQTTLTTVTYASRYALNPSEDINGRKFFCYKSGDSLIANNAVWNYIALTGYKHYQSETYTLLVSDYYLDNVYKVSLNNVISASSYELENSSFEFASNGAADTKDVCGFADLSGNVDAYNENTYKLVESYVENVVKSYISVYEEKIDGDGSNDDPILKKVYYSSGTLSNGVLTATNPTFHIYLANRQSIGDLPMFKHSYALLIAWNDQNATSYATLGINEDDEFTQELETNVNSGTWVYASGRTQFSAVYVYGFDAYYEDNNPADGIYSSKKLQWFGAQKILKQPEGLTATEIAKLPNGKSFVGWMIDGVSAAAQNYNITLETGENNIPFVVLTKSGVSIRFAYASQSQDGNYFYNINWISGTGILTQTTPIVLARYSRGYNLLIDNNKDIYWENKNVTKTDLYGAISSSENDSDLTRTSLTISSNGATVYPFQTTINKDLVGISFYKKDEMLNSKANSILGASNYYYVYNYGHTIVGWEISCLNTWFVYNGSSWSYNSTKTATDIANLDGVTFNNIAALVDDKFPSVTGDISVTITPVWEKSKIHALNDGTPVAVFDFAGSYTLSAASDIEGKKFFCYSASEQHVANSGVWDYTQISKGNYVSYPGVEYYEIMLTPQYLDNIYKVMLKDTPTDATIKNGTEYSIYNGAGIYNANYYSYSDLNRIGGENLDLTGLTLGDEISLVLEDHITDYEDFITSNKSTLYRKVFNDGTNLHIYLVNNSSVGILPTFTNDYKMEVLWKDLLSNPYVAEEYNESLYSLERNGKNIIDTWVYSNGCELTPVYVYALDLYYETISGDYATKKAAWFGLNTPKPLTALTSEEANSLPEGKFFSSWMLNTTAATAKGYTISESGKKVTLTLSNISITFDFNSKYGVNYYNLTSAQGVGVLDQDNENPIVLARLTREFNLTIDNSASYWADKDVTKTNLYGAISSSENDGDYTKTNIKIVDSAASAYPFQTSEQIDAAGNKFGLSFYKKSDLSVDVVNSKVNDSYYYVYNYGYYITNWLIEIKLVSTNTNKYVSYNGTAWSVADVGNPSLYYVSTNNAGKIDFQKLANFLDNQYASEKGNIEITIKPIWTETKITLNQDVVTYAKSYTLNQPTASEIPSGQSFFCYADNDGNMIANSAIWNYLDIDAYTYMSNGNYGLAIQAQHLNNVYKVTLSNTAVDDVVKNGGSYDVSSVGSSYNATEYNHSNIPGLTQPTLTSTNGLSDEISKNLEAFYDGYNNNLKNSPIYRKIFSYEVKYIYLIHNSAVGTLPTFEHTYKQEVLWKDTASNIYVAASYDSVYEGELRGQTLQTNWMFENGVSLTPMYVYRLDLYYEDANANDGIYSTKDAAWFGNQTLLEKPFKTEEFNESIPSGNVFAGWMVNAEMAKNVYGYTVANNTANKTITISSTAENFSLTFKYNDINDYNSNYYYEISSVQGYGVFTQSKVDINNIPQPIVLARFGRQYNLTIDNSSNYWNDKKVNDSELYGAYSSVGTNNGYAKTVMTIGNNAAYAYPFQASEQTGADGTAVGLSFYKRSSLNSSVINSKLDDVQYYYVYNYGHYITAWNISCSGVMFGYNNNAPWTVKKDGTIINNLIGVLNNNNVTFQDVAELMDEYFPLATGKPSVIITPVWLRVNIDVKYSAIDLVPVVSGNASGTISFGSNYTLDTKNIAQTLEKELIAFEYNDQDSSDTDFIATSAVWNYYNKNNAVTDISNKYIYTSGSTNGGGVYTLNVTPVFVDNIHKVNLTGTIKYEENSYQLTNSSYEFFTRAGTYDNAGNNVLTFKDSFGTYSFVTFDNKVFGFADEYIAKLIECKTSYVDGIKDGGLEVLRKVYYSSGTRSNATTLNSSNSNFWIYLANGQLTGDLPVFNNNYNKHILWQNIAHNDNSACVGVDTCSVVKHYIYLAGPYEAEFHEEDIKSNKYLLHDNDKNLIPEKVWFLKDGHSGENVTLNAKYFRNYYYLEVQTLVDSAIERRGYVRIDVLDKLYEVDNRITDRGGHYLVIAESNATNKMEMKVYQVDSEDKPIKDLTLTAFNELIKVYNGSEVKVSIKDQSKDSSSMATGQYDEMIGYKFTGNIDQSVTCEETEEMSLFNKNGYIYTANVSNLIYKSTSLFTLKVYFEKIKYELEFRIDNLKSGEFNIKLNNIYTGYKTNYSLTNMMVGNFYEVSYFAFAGYKLQNDAFMYNNNMNEKALQTYDDESNISQVYTITGNLNDNNLDGKWLRENFYSSYTAYPVDTVKLGLLTIQTEVVVFNYGVMIYDETDTTEQVVNNKGIVEVLEDGQFSLTYSTGVGAVNPVGDYLTNGNGFYYYDSLSGVDYALLSSRMLIPQNPTTTSDNFYTTYKFLLTENPTTQSVLNSSNLAFMVQSYENGKIISVSNRNIFILLEVRKIYTITMQVAVIENDPNDSARITTITNGNNNFKSITINANRGSLSGYYYADESSLTTSVIAYTYHGLNNNLASVYNTNKYKDVRYYLNGAANNLETNVFAVERNSTIDIEYIPNRIDIEYMYLLDGVDVIEEDVAPYILQTKPNVTEAGLQQGDVVTYSLELINEDYDARVTINGSVMGAANKDSSTLICSYTVSELDLSLNGIEILVEIYPRNNALINIHFSLIDSSKRDVDDVYGTFDVYVNENLKAENVDSTPVAVVEGRDVYVSLNLNRGYHLVGIKKGTYSIKEVTPDENGKISLVNNFNTTLDAGDYLIVIDKDDITAILDTSNVKTRAFEAYINGKSVLTDLYVGSVVEFTYADAAQERLDAFYCAYPDNSTEDIANVGGQIKFKITSEVLTRISGNTINFGVRTISRYSLNLNVQGQEYLSEQVSISYLDGTTYENGTYCDEGTELTFSVIPLGASEGKFKYDIAFNGNTYDIINKGEILIILDQSYSYAITITPKVFNVTVGENIYNDLTQLENGTPESVTTNQVNNMNIQGQTSYYSVTTLEFTRVARNADGALDRELSTIYIEDNDSDKVVIVDFDGTTFTATVDGVEVDLADYNYSISVNNRTVKLTYITLNNISITLDYKDYKVISSG